MSGPFIPPYVLFHRYQVVSVISETSSNLCNGFALVQHLVTLSEFGDDLFWCVSFALHASSSRIYFGRSSHIRGGSSEADHSTTKRQIHPYECHENQLMKQSRAFVLPELIDVEKNFGWLVPGVLGGRVRLIQRD